ncbi:hypothetical protein PHMEG_00022320 [Phytophthora megakarya]|uniref:Ubiquitin-like protease family profile domain-containing protein n=1 Tax=Phytophthora megakarya TaxID=4795 RepID=A0A225VKN6_9STRA|nr:hypothetical protein PHMEG_00022320 [Phytophthora megakarya]
MPRCRGTMYACTTNLYSSIVQGKKISKPEILNAWIQSTSGKLEWGAYPFVVVPIYGSHQWSVVIVENALQAGPTSLYHVNRFRACHNSGRIFENIRSYLAHEQNAKAPNVPPTAWNCEVFYTKALQSNTVDCGLYVFHFIDNISRAIMRAMQMPRCISDKMAEWACGTFNDNASGCLRTIFYNRIISDANAKTCVG